MVAVVEADADELGGAREGGEDLYVGERDERVGRRLMREDGDAREGRRALVDQLLQRGEAGCFEAEDVIAEQETGLGDVVMGEGDELHGGYLL